MRTAAQKATDKVTKHAYYLRHKARLLALTKASQLRKKQEMTAEKTKARKSYLRKYYRKNRKKLLALAKTRYVPRG